MKVLDLILVIGCLFLAVCLSAQQGGPRPPGGGTCESGGRVQCAMTAPFMGVSITEDDTYRYVTTSTCPMYNNPNWNNPNQACQSEKNYVIPKNPTSANVPIPVGEAHSVVNGITYLKENPRPALGVLGVLLSGVNVFGVGAPCGGSSSCPPDQGAPTQWVDAVESEGHTVDPCGGHASPQNEYHIHSGLFINSTSGREACRLPVDVPGEHSKLLGWMFDGYGLYGEYSLNGTRPDDLDTCGGHAHLIEGVMTYHYHLPDQFPWVIGCFKGCPLISNNPNQFSFTTSSTYGCSDTSNIVREETTTSISTTDGQLQAGFGALTLLFPTILLLVQL